MADNEFVKIISSEGHEFYLEKKYAMVSGTIRSMLTGPGQFSETQLGEVRFPEISAPLLEKVIQYFHYKHRYTNSDTPIPEFKIEPESALELLMAANYLDT
eukprot:GILK01005830.1.p1 GENE.GILK01005830.1~~GILK01005830.1.p1  ORF type:complete len:116 (+),score=15.87 GILK01005830.1:47-349(+)